MEDSPPDSAMTDSSDWENRSWDELDEEFVVNKPPARDAPPQTVDWDDDDDSDTEMKHASASAERGGQPPRPAAGTSGSSTLVVTPCHGGRFVRFCVSATVFEVTSKYGPPIGYLGKGAYGAVCYAFDSERGELVAIKKIADAFSNPVEGKRALREVKLLRYMDHPNIVPIRDIIPPANRESFKDVYISSELMGSNMHELIYSEQPLTERHYHVQSRIFFFT